MTAPDRRSTLLQFAAAAAIAILGLVWRLAPLGLPPFALRYGGSLLWGAMVLLAVGAPMPPAWKMWIAPAVALSVAVASELFRLVHTPALDAFRLTLPGALLLGRFFSLSNIVAYALGIGAAVPLRLALLRATRLSRSPRREGTVRPP